MLIVCLAGIGASVTAGSAAALALVSITFCVQLLVFLWITCLCPSTDRVDNVAVALGWGVESCSMLLLVLASFLPSLRTDSFQTAAYALSLLGVPPIRALAPWRRSAAAQAELRCDPRATRQLLTPVHRRRGAYQPVQHGHAASASPAARHGRTEARRYLLRLLHLLLREELRRHDGWDGLAARHRLGGRVWRTRRRMSSTQKRT